MIPIKEDSVYAVLADDGSVAPDREDGAGGFYRHDTRFLSLYRWELPGFTLVMSHTPDGARLVQHWARLVHHAQQVALRRELTLRGDGFEDRLILENTSLERQELTLTLAADGDFTDLFVVRGWGTLDGGTVQRQRRPEGLTLDHTAGDGVTSQTRLDFDTPAAEQGWSFTLQAKEAAQITVRGAFTASLDAGQRPPLPDYGQWRARFPVHFQHDRVQRVFDQAVDDLRALLLSTPHGPYPAAGVPWYVAPFGRDGLITALMCLPWDAALAAGVLQLLAALQGRENDAFREEQPGKVLHETRQGELARTGRIPFGRYYGSADATPLYLLLLDEYVRWTGDEDKIKALEPHWKAALDWTARHEDTEGGFVCFQPAGGGLAVQSWKDSAESMSHADGRLGEPPLAVSEVQGYAYAAYLAAARFFDILGDPAQAAQWQLRAGKLQERFHAKFWQEDMSTYALALDYKGHPLRVLSSDPGHLLWCGIVPPPFAERLVATLMSDKLWSGWGLRTLGSTEVRYNPVSYHNGSVWPHDTAIFAGGLARYGFEGELAVVAEALVDLAESQPDRRLPELVAGYPRSSEPPIPYRESCRPQAWSAASLPYVVSLAWKMSPRIVPQPPAGPLAGRLGGGNG
ncbi:MAG: amylo-alpha-1,6-glucosidase [Pseudomonadota bacterium]|nr:amylo-alpha-1,6-glucosidase [Pseudomonadota bacterium]